MTVGAQATFTFTERGELDRCPRRRRDRRVFLDGAFVQDIDTYA